MPFRHAHWWVLSIFPLAALAFWPNYLSAFGKAPPSYHFHGITASLWLVLLALQSWSIHHGKRAFHRTNGLVSFALFPLFMAGGATIFVGMAQRYVSPPNGFYALYPPRLAWLDLVAIIGLAVCYYHALKYRRQVGRHASWMLATSLFLLPPVFGRLAPLAMGLDPTATDFFERMHMGFHYGNIVPALIAFLIAWRAGSNGRPFALVGVLTLVGSVLFEVPGGTAAWARFYSLFADLPTAGLAVLAAAFGAAVGWAGWQAGKAGSPVAVAAA